ncbi:MAG: sigma 54-interacting transcriptional regulator [Myxococcales bacterium]|nr:sigma 54-interacting transcriptional regulator [Myxococcales bacterium]
MSGTPQRPSEDTTLRLQAPGPGYGTLTALWDGGAATLALPQEGTCIIGRSATSSLVIDHPSLSRHHAALHIGPDLYIEDLGSSNGTTIRGRILKPQERMPLAWGEPFELGRVVVIARLPANASRAPDPPDHPTMANVKRLVELVSPTDISVLILGETGAGKGWIAQQIHGRSRRAAGPWLHLNCAALPEHLLESELFGYERGAFTGAAQSKPGLLESASGGTVFLDEIGDIPLATQAKLLIAIERREVLRLGALKPRAFDARFVSATNRDLESGPAREAFRRDLYYRLAGLTINVPPLRSRRDELPSLVQTLLEASASRLGRPVPAVGPSALMAIQSYEWPGNVRELGSVLERALLWCGPTLESEHLGLRPSLLPPAPGPSAIPPPRASQPYIPPPEPSRRTLAEDVHAVERKRIIEALEQCGGNQSRAAELLGVSRRTLINRMIEFGLPRPRKG